MKQLSRKLGDRSRSSIYRDLEEGRLPQPIRLGTRLYWIEDQVDDHIAEQFKAEAA